MNVYVTDTLRNGKRIFAAREIVKGELLFIAQGGIVLEKCRKVIVGRARF